LPGSLIAVLDEEWLIMKVLMEQIPVIRDERGCVFEPLSGEHLKFQKNVHVVLTQPGMWRANHYHRLGTEILVVYGPALFRYREDGAVVNVPIPEDLAMRFTVPPGVPHAVQNTGNEVSLVVAFNTEVHDPSNPDTVADSLICV
jgi:dTDP-4-dehydrorhamnose 3,5-epimerase-like enzyme